MIEVRISYDYELFWGVWDKVSPSYVSTNVQNANAVTRGLVALHKKHGICCTFAIVGAMLDRQHAPRTIMQKSARSIEEISNFELCAAPFGDQDDLFRAPDDIIEELESDPLFELGSHTNTHIYALGASESALRADFEQFDALFFHRFGFRPKVLVMPKNQVTLEALEVAASFGYESVRVNPDIRIYRPVHWGWFTASVIRLIRFADAFLPIVEFSRTDQFTEKRTGQMRIHVGQYFLRPWFSRTGVFTLHLLRMQLAVFLSRFRNHQVHFWLHPHNLGREPEQALANYDRFLTWLKKQEEKGTIQFSHMADK
ncbi:MAG: polysaccharide deacetylase family protein [Rhizobiaceae bacterium]